MQITAQPNEKKYDLLKLNVRLTSDVTEMNRSRYS